MTNKIIFRFAPTPSGFLHIGNVASFMFTALLAKKENALILLRIDDLDSDRTRSVCIDDIFRTLDILGIEYQIGPKNTDDFYQNYSQLTRLPLYNEALHFLTKSNHLFACVCSRKDREMTQCTCAVKNIPFATPNVAWRLKIDSSKRIESVSENGEKRFYFLKDNFVVRQKNGKPAYQLSTIIDDIHFGVNRIVRGEDLFESTLMQVYLASFLPQNNYFNAVKFWHHPLLTDAVGVKLSKSAGATAISVHTHFQNVQNSLTDFANTWLRNVENTTFRIIT